MRRAVDTHALVWLALRRVSLFGNRAPWKPCWKEIV